MKTMNVPNLEVEGYNSKQMNQPKISQPGKTSNTNVMKTTKPKSLMKRLLTFTAVLGLVACGTGVVSAILSCPVQRRS